MSSPLDATSVAIKIDTRPAKLHVHNNKILCYMHEDNNFVCNEGGFVNTGTFSMWPHTQIHYHPILHTIAKSHLY